MKTASKFFFSLLLALVIVFSFMTASAFAEETDTPANEAELRSALADSGLFEVFVQSDFTVTEDITIPQGKRLVLLDSCTLTFTENVCLTVEGEIYIDRGSTLDASKAEGFIIMPSCFIQLLNQSYLKINDETYKNRADGERIHVSVNGGFYKAVTGVDAREYINLYDVHEPNLLNTAKEMALSHSNDERFFIIICTDMSISKETIPSNAVLVVATGGDEEEGPSPVAVTLENVTAPQLHIWGFGNTITVNGTLDLTDGWLHIDGVGEGQDGNVLIVNGTMHLGSGGAYIGWGSSVENNGTVTVDDVDRIGSDGSWYGNFPIAPNAPTDEEGLKAALADESIYTVILAHGLTLTDDLTVPEGKELYISPRCEGLIVPEGTALTVNGRLVVGGLLDASAADGLTVGETGELRLENTGILRANSETYHPVNDWYEIDVDAYGRDGDLSEVVTGLNREQYKFIYDVQFSDEYPEAISLAENNPEVRMMIVIRCNMNVSGTLPDNAELVIGRNWADNGSYVTASIDEGDELNAGRLTFWDAGGRLEVHGTLNAGSVDVSEPFDDYVGNTLDVCDGTAVIDRLYVGRGSMASFGAFGSAVVTGSAEIEGTLNLFGGHVDASGAGIFQTGSESNVWVDTGSSLSIDPYAYDCPTQFSHIWVNVRDGFDTAVNAVSGLRADQVNYQYDTFSDAEFAAAMKLARSHWDILFHVNICYTAELSGELPANVYLRLNNNWAEDDSANTLTVPADEELILHNNLDICGEGNKFIVNGTVNFVSGGMGIRNSSSLFVDEIGSVTIGDAHLDVDEFASAENNGRVTVRYMRNVHINGSWRGNPVDSLDAISTEAGLVESLADETLYEIFINGDLTINGDVTVPQDKCLVVGGNLTVNGTVKVWGEIEVSRGGTVDAENAEGFILEETGSVYVEPDAALMLGSGYENNAGRVCIFVNISEGGYRQAVTGVDSSEYVFFYDMFDGAELSDVIAMAGGHPDDSFSINVCDSIDLYTEPGEKIPENVILLIAWDYNGAGVTVTVPEGRTLAANGVEIGDRGSTLNVYGTLDVTDGHISLWDVGEDMPGSTLNVMECGSVMLGNGRMYVGQGATVNNGGTITAREDNIFGPGTVTGNDPVCTYTVTYDANGGSDAPEAQIKEPGVALTLSETVPERGDDIFLGWATNAEAADAEYRPGDSYTEDADVTLYAVWCGPEAILKLPAALKKIDAEAFAGVTAKVIVVPEGVTEIGSRAFAECPNLRQVIFLGTPASIEEDYLEDSGDVLVIEP